MDLDQTPNPATILDEAIQRLDEQRGQGSLIDREVLRLQGELPEDSSNLSASQLHNIDIMSIHNSANILNSGDTMVFIDFPTPSETMKMADCLGQQFKSVVLRVHSSKLLATGSQRFATMLGPLRQKHAVKRLRSRLPNALLPDDVKYLIDLTPSTADDQAFQDVLELSLPTGGIASWWKMEEGVRVSGRLCAGHDDVCECTVYYMMAGTEGSTSRRTSTIGPAPLERTSTAADGTADNGERAQTSFPRPGTSSGPGSPQSARTTTSLLRRGEGDPFFRNIPDYCPIRHRVNIIRLLLGIQGRDILLNSAQRVWTIVGLAKLFDCTSLISGAVFQWLIATPNSQFVEHHPEEALRLATALQIPDVTRAAFRILVNESAFDIAGYGNTRARLTKFGRKRADLPDDLDNIREHGARAFADRAKNTLDALKGDQVFSFFGISEYQRFVRAGEIISRNVITKNMSNLAAMHADLREALLDFFHEQLTAALYHAPVTGYFNSVDNARKKYTSDLDFVPLQDLWPTMTDVQKTMTPYPYRHLEENWKSRDSFQTHYAPRLSAGLSAFSFTGNQMVLPLRTAPTAITNPSTTVGDGASSGNSTGNGEGSSGPAASLQNLDPVASPGPPSNISRLVHEFHALLRMTGFGATDGPAIRELHDELGNLKHASLSRDLTLSSRRYAFEELTFYHELTTAVTSFCLAWTARDGTFPIVATPHLALGRDMDELRFLPLWAGGSDDGSGGVFQDFVPPAALGPIGPGPAFHTGITIPSSDGGGGGSGAPSSSAGWSEVPRGPAVRSLNTDSASSSGVLVPRPRGYAASADLNSDAGFTVGGGELTPDDSVSVVGSVDTAVRSGATPATGSASTAPLGSLSVVDGSARTETVADSWMDVDVDDDVRTTVHGPAAAAAAADVQEQSDVVNYDSDADFFDAADDDQEDDDLETEMDEDDESLWNDV